MTPRSPEAAGRKAPARPLWRAGVVLVAGTLAFGCAPSGNARERTPETGPPSTTVQASTTEQDRLRAIAREELTSPDAQDAPRARAYLENLSPDVRRRVALAIGVMLGFLVFYKLAVVARQAFGETMMFMGVRL